MKHTLGLLGVVAMLLLTARFARADSFDVTLNTSSLSGTQALVFVLTDGDGAADNSITLNGFAFGGGSATGSADYLGSGGVSGDLTSGITMNDASLSFAIFTQDFNPGTALSYVLTTTNNFNTSGFAPDGFEMLVCSTDLSDCYSDSADGTLLNVALTGSPLSPSSFTTNGATDQGLPAPVVTAAVTTPEPGSMVLLAVGFLGLLFVVQRRPQNGSAAVC
jgi:hypothetical protein